MPAKKKKRVPRLPRQLLAIQNGDKPCLERWDERRSRDLANFPNPSRILLVGPPNSGKSCLVKQLVMHQSPRFDEVFLVHLDAGHTKDYADLDVTAEMPDIPTLEFFNALPTHNPDTGKRIRRAIIVDDLELTHATKERAKNLAILFRFVSSHAPMTVYYATQSYFDIPPLVKKMASTFILWRPRSNTELKLIEDRCGCDRGLLRHLFDSVCTTGWDNICIDHTDGSPAPLRKNLFEKIELVD
jgi:GTPase SAR1 family protein